MTKHACQKVTHQVLLPAVLIVLALAACGSPTAVPEHSPVPVTEIAELESSTSRPATATATPAPTSTFQPTSTPQEEIAAEPPTATLTMTTETPTATTPPTATPTDTPEEPTVTAPPSATPTDTPEEPTATVPPTTTPTDTPELPPPTPTPSPEPSPVSPKASPTVAPSAKPKASATSAPAPQVLSFRVSPEVTLNIGEKVSIKWKALGEKAELCPISGRGPVEPRCEDVPLKGSSKFTTDEESMTYTGFGLRVTTGDSFTWGTAQVNFQCLNQRTWFFEDAPQRCPEDDALESYAAGQYFEGGMMMWVEEPDDFYVFYEGKDEYGFQTFDWVLDPQGSLKPGASPDNRVGETPPEGFQEPVSGFGMVWRGEVNGVRDDVRDRLGWATEPEFGFDTAYQCITPSHPGLWSCFLRGPRGEILYLHPDSTAQVRFLWDEW